MLERLSVGDLNRRGCLVADPLWVVSVTKPGFEATTVSVRERTSRISKPPWSSVSADLLNRDGQQVHQTPLTGSPCRGQHPAANAGRRRGIPSGAWLIRAGEWRLELAP